MRFMTNALALRWARERGSRVRASNRFARNVQKDGSLLSPGALDRQSRVAQKYQFGRSELREGIAAVIP
jgi:hypothetical protein